MPSVSVLFFAIAKARVNADSCVVEIGENATVETVREEVLARFPALCEIEPYVRWALNEAFVGDLSVIVHDGDELAMIPPVSGGSYRYFTEDAIDADATIDSVRSPQHGAVLSFIGTVRNQTDASSVKYLEYEVYESMAEKLITEILGRARVQWPSVKVALKHRLGRVEIGEISIVIAVGSPHRAAAYETSRFIIEELKKDVPIFKKEVRADGSQWVGMGS